MYTTGADPLKLGLLVFYQFAHSGVDLGRTGHARSALYTVVASTLTKLGVAYSMPSVRRTRPGDMFNSQARNFTRGAPAVLLTDMGALAGM
ncbi:hypothetical protein WJX84_008853 [Apatococcus fuscideae]|uniref:Uncharacterized protein n=1 Tax=Apatococcus fuscideae TaxID=2026836 RepID=A0AAW1SX03_9CHLO